MPEKPDIAPSYEVHISPSKTKGTVGFGGPDFWVQRGFDLKSMVSMVYEKDASRVTFPEALDSGNRFDFVVVLPKEEGRKTIYQLVQRSIEKQFKVSAVTESKPAEVYVMTAIQGKTPPVRTTPASVGGSGRVSALYFSMHPEKMGLSSIDDKNVSLDQFRQDLEEGLGRPVIDETGLEGVYDLEVRGKATSQDEFIRNLRDQLGLVLTSATRSIEFLTLRPLN